jgi:hypothetical protein
MTSLRYNFDLASILLFSLWPSILRSIATAKDELCAWWLKNIKKFTELTRHGVWGLV